MTAIGGVLILGPLMPCAVSWIPAGLTPDQLQHLGAPPADARCTLFAGHQCPHVAAAGADGRRFKWTETHAAGERTVVAGWSKPRIPQGAHP